MQEKLIRAEMLPQAPVVSPARRAVMVATPTSALAARATGRSKAHCGTGLRVPMT